ncbi:MAG: penicillin-binding protein [Candidatus Pacebacteria bacterium]|nr:penicillin-binding protein [Candidatus Paceibacterota bacterium]
MFSRKRSIDKYRRAHLKRQKIKAQRHRKYMELRRKIHAIESESYPENSFSGIRKFFIIIARFLKIIGIYFKNIGSFISTQFQLGWKKIYMFLVKSRYQFFALCSFIKKDIIQVFNERTSMNTRKKIPSATEGLHVRKKRKKHKKKNNIFSLKNIFLGILTLGLLVLGAFFVWFSTLEIPSVENFENRKISNSTKIYDQTGDILLYDIHEDIRRTVIDFEDINQSAKDAIVAIEDHTFYEHNGVVWRSTFRAVVQTVLSRLGLSNEGVAGGSTLTQQVVKNTLLTRDRDVTRKVKEWVLAYKIEDRLTKDEILEIYLNEAPYGGTIYGIQEASKRFFGIPASELSVAQSAYLAAIPNLPTFYSPYGPNKDLLDQRQQTVLREMQRYGFISDAQYRDALNEQVEFLPEEDGFAKSLHFVQYVRAELEEMYGVDMVQNGGLQVRTTLNYELQQQAETIIREHIEEVEEEYDASNAALVAVEAETGKIIAMVGSRDYNDTEDFDGNFNVAISPRQPGSSFKPFAYATAFEKGYLPESSIFDTETQFNSRCEADDRTSEDGCYSPNNYDFQFKGPMSFRNALAQSRNIPAIKVNHLAGLPEVIEKARNLGITSLTERPSFYGLGLVLGGGEVSLLEMTGAYSVLANEGIKNDIVAIEEVADINGKVIDKFVSNEERVIEQNAARMVNDILADNEARTPLFGAQSFLYFGERDVAGKTGTTNDNRDAWLIGYTPEIAVGVWTGNNDNSPMKRGSSISGKPWRRFMDEVLKEYDGSSFGSYELPDDMSTYPAMLQGNWFGGETVFIDSVSGKLATEFTPEETKVAIPIPDPHTILHWIDKDNPRVLNTSQNDPQYENWEFSVQEYVQQNFAELVGIDFDLPTEYDDVHGPDTVGQPVNFFEIEIEGIEEDIVYDSDTLIEIEVSSPDRRNREVEKVQLFINNAYIGEDTGGPFEFNFFPNELQYFDEENIMRVIMIDEDGERASQEINFSLNLVN